MKLIFCLMMAFSSLSFAQEETDFDKFVDQKKKENLSPETLEKLEPVKDETPPQDGETKFDQILDKKKKKYFNEKDLKPRKQQGLIDPLIDRTKDASEVGKKKLKK